MTLADSNRRAADIERAARPKPTPTGRHRQRVEPKPKRRAVIGTAVVATLALSSGGAWLALDGDPPVAAATAVTVPVDQAERNYLAELRYAGLDLTEPEQQAAVDIAREHVAHGHLIGMRTIIVGDFRERIPRLTDEQIDVARVAVEHHFLAVTGRKQ
jgi:hypothetical protein